MRLKETQANKNVLNYFEVNKKLLINIFLQFATVSNPDI